MVLGVVDSLSLRSSHRNQGPPMTKAERPLRASLLSALLLVSLCLGACDALDGPKTDPLRLTSDPSEPGWNYATDGEVVAACPTNWTLEQTVRPNRAWRCRHHDAIEGVAGCGLTVYRARGADTLEELRDRIQPEIEGYGEDMEVLRSGRSTLGGLDAYELEVTQRINGAPFHSWYRMTRRDTLAWLGHCIIPVNHVDEDREVVEAIFERIQL